MRVQFSKKMLENENSRIVKSWHHTATVYEVRIFIHVIKSALCWVCI